jgi:hypothetical protein
MKLAFFGDVVGRSGRNAVSDHLPRLRKQLGLDAVIINAENAAGGFGITEGTAEHLFAAGADVLTLGNHSFDQPQGIGLIEREGRILRPANYPSGTPGRGANLYDVNGYQMLVVSLHGRVFMDSLDDPFQAAQILSSLIFTLKRRVRKTRWVIFVMAARALSLAPINMSRPLTRVSFRKGRLTRLMRACAATIIQSLAWILMSRCAGLQRGCGPGGLNLRQVRARFAVSLLRSIQKASPYAQNRSV